MIKSKKKWLIISPIVIIGVLFFSYYLKLKQKKYLPVATVAVKIGSIEQKAQAIGYIKPEHSNIIKSSVNGSVEKIFHDTGEYVKKGTILLKVKPEPEPVDYASAYQMLQQAVISEKSARDNLERYKKALKTGLITKNYTSYIDAKKAYKEAKEERVLASQKLALLDKGTIKVGKKKIANIVTSPINGYILTRNVDVGDPVISLSSAQASTILFTMANMKNLVFKGSIDEMDASRIHLGMEAIISIGAIDSKKEITGTVTKIGLQSEQENEKTGSSSIDSNLPFNVSFQVEISHLKIPKGLLLRSGYSAVATINIKTAKDVLILPERVLHFKGDAVYVLLPSEKKNEKDIEREVTIGISNGITAQITNGLKLGERVLD